MRYESTYARDKLSETMTARLEKRIGIIATEGKAEAINDTISKQLPEKLQARCARDMWEIWR